MFTAQGYNVVSGVPVPKAIVETLQFNGDGTLVATISINGITGTYVVQRGLRRQHHVFARSLL